MSNICIVASCNTRRTRNTDKTTAIKCFSFPKDPNLKKQWLNLCQAKEEHNRKVCIKHFKEDDFVDGLKARLMCVQPTRLKKEAVPSLFLSPEILTGEIKQKQIQNQEEILTKYIFNNKKIRIPTIKDNKRTNPTKRSMEYLSKLVPIAPKVQGVKRGIIVPKNPLLQPTPKSTLITTRGQKTAVKNSALAEEIIAPNDQDNTISPKDPNPQPKTLILTETKNGVKPEFMEQNLKSQIHAEFNLHQIKILQHDNAIYKMKINTLLDSQNKLLARIKELEAKIESQKEDFVVKIKATFAHVLSSNQVDNILGKKKHIWWTNDEYSKALKLWHINKYAYKYVKDRLNYPLPCITNVLKWSKREPERAKQFDENKENDGNVDDETMVDNHVKPEIKNEYSDINVGMQYEQDFDDYTIKTHNGDCDIEYGDDFIDNDESNIDEINQVADENSDHDIEIDHYIGEHSPDDDNEQNEEIYEELIIDNDFSDDDVMYGDQQTEDDCTEKDNG